MEALFAKPEAPGAVESAKAGRVVGVVVNSNVWKTFDYLWPDELGEPSRGQRVRVPFGMGNRKTLAFVVETGKPAATGAPAKTAGPEDQPAAPLKLKHVAEVIDDVSQFDPILWKLGEWISHYYLTPLGMVLAAMVPSAVGRHAPREEAVAFLARERKEWPSSLRLRQRSILDELYEARKQGVEPIPIEQLIHHSGAKRDTVRRLMARGLVRLETRPVVLPDLDASAESAPPFELNDEQKAVLAEVEGRLGQGFSPMLLRGVTGSGKTEVYVRAIRKVVESGNQAILMAPEIALATQTLQRLIKRLPRVAVLHSGLTDGQRAFYYQQIRDGHASVVVGPRSAVFAPCRRLGLVVVDEEHEPTYKQDSAPRYHGRDVAVMRGSLAGVPVILGSATPSLESLHNAQQGRYRLLRLPHRVRGLPMPRLQIVRLRDEIQAGRVELIGRTLTAKMAAALDRREQIILLMNRRGYASYVFCPSCRWTMTCENCTRAMVFHQATRLVLCHYCQHTSELPEQCPACGKKLLLFGYGIQRIENELAAKFPNARAARMDSDTMTTPQQFQRVFDELAAGKIDILLGTQMVAKGLDFPRVSLVGVVSADTSLSIADFRAAERTFQLIVQVAGRAGRGQTGGEVVVQTLHDQEPAIVFAATHDYDGFAAKELALRKQIGYPPFSRIVRLISRHKNVDKARQGAADLAAALKAILSKGGEPGRTGGPSQAIRIIGPQPAQVLKVRNEFRFDILLMSARPGAIQQLLAGRMDAICRPITAEIIADVDPVNLL
ncbi:MAG: primosomal protein N' [Phycisphaerae bacterium]